MDEARNYSLNRAGRMTTDPDASAYPIPTVFSRADDLNVIYGVTGLTKREYFAALASQGLCASNGTHLGSPDFGDIYMPRFASRAVMIADALIAELNRVPTN